MMDSSPVVLLMVGVEMKMLPSIALWKYSRSE